MTNKSRICLLWREHMTNTIIICRVLRPPEKYEKFIVGSQPIRMREYTAMNNSFEYPAQPQLIIVKYPISSEPIRLQNTYCYIDCHRILSIL